MEHVLVRFIDTVPRVPAEVLDIRGPGPLGEDPDSWIKHPCAPPIEINLPQLQKGDGPASYAELGGGNVVSDTVFDVQDATLWRAVVERALGQDATIGTVIEEVLREGLRSLAQADTASAHSS